MLYNLREVHRPTDIDEAVKLLRRKKVRTAAMAGGTALVGEGGPEIEAVVDLDGLGLDRIERRAGAVIVGATTRLQTIVSELSDVADGLLAEAARRMAGWHIRNAATLGGALFTAPGSAPLLPVLAALEAEVTLHAPRKSDVRLADFLGRRERLLEAGALLTGVRFGMPAGGVGFGFAHVGRTPADEPIVCAAARVEGDEVRVWLGGVGPGVAAAAGGDEGEALAAVAALPEPPSDYLGSAEYRTEMAAVLARRALAQARRRAGES